MFNYFLDVTFANLRDEDDSGKLYSLLSNETATKY